MSRGSLNKGSNQSGCRSAANIDKPIFCILFDFMKQIFKNRQTESYHKVLTAMDAVLAGHYAELKEGDY